MTDPIRTVGRYEIMHRLGRGGMAVVHLARQSDLDRLVALKELNALDAEEPSTARRFLHESRLAGSLAHPSIVHVYDYFEYEGTPYIAMEYLAGGTLRPYVGHMTFSQIAGVLEAVLSGLTHAEQEGIVHRDLKPENVLVAPDGRVKIADFGIAKAINRVNPSAFLTATGMAVGTPAYMAPEQAMAGKVGPWTDLYAVGCMAFEFFTSAVPFADADTPMALLLRRINEPTPQAAEVNPSVPPSLSAWIDRLLLKDPAARTQSAEEASDELEDIVIGMAGARWRRSARLPASVAAGAPVDPTAVSEGLHRSPSEGLDDASALETPHGSAAGTGLVTPPPDGAIPGPYTPPPDDAIPGTPLSPLDNPIPDAIPGPYTPPPAEAIPTDDGFVTFGGHEAPADDLAAESPPAEVTPDEEAKPVEEPDPAASGDDSIQAYETYRAPPPLRPPSGVEADEVEEATPSAEPPVPVPAEPEAAHPVPPPAPVPAEPEAVPPMPVPAEPVTPRAPVTADLGSAATVPPRERPPVSPPEATIHDDGDDVAGRVRRRRLGLVAAVVMLLGVIGYLLAPTRVDSVPLRADQKVAGKNLQFGVPSGWRAGSAGDVAIPGLALQGASVQRPPRAARGEDVVAGFTATRDRSLLPPEFVKTVTTDPIRKEIVDFGAGPAYRYAQLRQRGSSLPVTFYLLPTSGGVATLACRGLPGSPVATACNGIARTFEPKGVRVYSPAPRARLARALNPVLTRLQRDETTIGSRLQRARTLKPLVAGLGDLEQAYGRAGEAVAKLDAAPYERPAIDSIHTPLQRLQRQYTALAAAASRHQRSRYRALTRRISSQRAALRSGVKQLEALGFEVGSR